ncbi:L-rhamnose/proton symporter RhaT [Flavobacterium subsaxonicum]|uniref:Sugar:proton symporter n=1 Tax=Flavobacterium subsaxonicum WB 4.1-42 = DSM 21790 TaxID=1121898 RepID=A0A0A2MS98_9FLAO|nr:L-rhamnose/proton symporter RhaT [Flavobacterium subsaxonicum]KGO91120.1 sugar:proton symporter [Flavobacterium subsaxonicum WB 4.1-42 = DSM 21790]
MHALFGVFFHLIGSVAAGSFYMPYKKVKGWQWESYWITGGFFSWLIAPFLALWITFPDFTALLFSNTTVMCYAIFFGILWGIGGLTYGLGMRFLGLSLGNSVMLGFSSAFGALFPAIYYNFNPQHGKVSLNDMIGSTGGRVILFGILLCLIGIAVSGRAGMMKEKEQRINAVDKPKTDTEFSFKKGIIVAVLSGILSSCFNYGIEAGKPLAEAAVQLGVNPLFQNNITFVLVLWGGFTTNFIWCTYLIIKNKSYTDFANKRMPLTKNYIFCALAGTTWFLQFFFYGMGESRLGNGASSWILHMSAIILVGNLWGLYLKEWKGVSKATKTTMITGVAVLLISVIIVGYGNYLS